MEFYFNLAPHFVQGSEFSYKISQIQSSNRDAVSPVEVKKNKSKYSAVVEHDGIYYGVVPFISLC